MLALTAAGGFLIAGCLDDPQSPAPVAAAVDAGTDIRTQPGKSTVLTARIASRDAAMGYRIDWGDGQVASGSVLDSTGLLSATHTYATLGSFTVRVMANPGDTVLAWDTVTVNVEAPGTPQILVGAGDIGECGLPHKERTSELLDAIPGTVFTVGDNAYPDGSAADFAACYAPFWGRHKKRTHPSVGNHEYKTPGAAGYFGYFGVAAGDPRTGYYSYDLGEWHIIVLNSNIAGVNMKIPLAPELDWLRADLAGHPAACTLAMWHHPRFSSGTTHGSDTTLAVFWQVLYDADADVVVSGHEHNYERFAPQSPAGALDTVRGIREFVAGTGGGGFDPLGPPIANSQAASIDHGVLELILRPGAYSWRFVPMAGQTFSDSGTAACH